MSYNALLYAFSLIFPTILWNLGYKTVLRRTYFLFSPYAAAAVITIFIGWLANRTKARGYYNTGVSIIGITGFCMLLGTANPSVQNAVTPYSKYSQDLVLNKLDCVVLIVLCVMIGS